MVRLGKREIIELLLLLIILVIVLVIVFKTLVISTLVGKARNYESDANAYERIEFENSDKVKSYNIYKKGNYIKVVIYTKRGGRITKYGQYSDSYFDQVGDETINELADYSKRNFNIAINCFSSDTIWDIIQSAMICKFENAVSSDGTKCYVFTNMYNKQSLETQGIKSVKLYISKKDGVPVERVEENNDGTTNTIKFQYEFNRLTDGDVKQASR